MQNAPLVVVVLAHKQAYLDRYGEPHAEATWPAPYWFVDAGMAALLILLSAVDEGLGACFFGIQMTAHRRPMADVVHRGRWGG